MSDPSALPTNVAAPDDDDDQLIIHKREHQNSIAELFACLASSRASQQEFPD